MAEGFKFVTDARHLGFTGTRSGMTPEQQHTVRRLFEKEGSFTFHHGDCVGADTEAHNLACDADAYIVLHPPIKDDLRSFCESDERHSPKSYFARNRDIVEASHVLVATPFTAHETQGGTWYTINYARKRKAKGDPITIIIVQPDGSEVRE